MSTAPISCTSPKGVSADIVDKLAKAAEVVKADRGYNKNLENAMATPASEKTPAEFAKWLEGDRQAWSAIAAKAKVTVE